MIYSEGQTVSCPRAGENAVVCRRRPAVWGRGAFEIQLEVDEPLPFIGRDNPRRKIWVHESWIKPCER